MGADEFSGIDGATFGSEIVILRLANAIAKTASAIASLAIAVAKPANAIAQAKIVSLKRGSALLKPESVMPKVTVNVSSM